LANTILNTSIIAKAAVRILENELVMAGLVYRGHESEYAKKVSGYEVGETISIKKPPQFTVRTGLTASSQDVTEGKMTMTVDTVKGIDFEFTVPDLTLKISDLSERVIRPAMIRLANDIDQDVMSLYKDVPNWVGTPGQTVNSFADFAKAPERLDLGAVPSDMRAAVMSPTDHWAMAGSQTALYMQNVAQSAYRRGSIGEIAGCDTYKSQNVLVHTCGTRDNTTPLIKGAAQNTTWAAVKDTEAAAGIQSLDTDGWDNSATIEKGCVFTIDGVYAVNPVTKAVLPHLQQFVVRTAVTAHASGGTTTLSISPAIITSGAFQTVSAAPADDAPITVVGAASTGYAQNLVFHKNAFALAVVPLVVPPAAVGVARESYKGLSVMLTPYFDGGNFISKYRLDVLYGKKTVDERLATRLSGTA
jgi:hypothetical protein